MFNCAKCSKPTGPGVSPILIVEEEPFMHKFHDAEGVEHQVEGTRIVRETKICPECAGVPVPQKVEVDYSGTVASAAGYFSHLRSCKKATCKVCSRINEILNNLPPQVLTEALR